MTEVDQYLLACSDILLKRQRNVVSFSNYERCLRTAWATMVDVWSQTLV